MPEHLLDWQSRYLPEPDGLPSQWKTLGPRPPELLHLQQSQEAPLPVAELKLRPQSQSNLVTGGRGTRTVDLTAVHTGGIREHIRGGAVWGGVV